MKKALLMVVAALFLLAPSAQARPAPHVHGTPQQECVNWEEDVQGIPPEFVTEHYAPSAGEIYQAGDATCFYGHAAGNPDTFLGSNDPDYGDLAGGQDTLVAAGGDDFVHGDSGADTLDGDSGNDLLFGDGGGDNIRGDGGDDFLTDGAGKDTVNGGPGEDTFFKCPDGNADAVLNVEHTQVLSAGSDDC